MLQQCECRLLTNPTSSRPHITLPRAFDLPRRCINSSTFKLYHRSSPTHSTALRSYSHLTRHATTSSSPPRSLVRRSENGVYPLRSSSVTTLIPPHPASGSSALASSSISDSPSFSPIDFCSERTHQRRKFKSRKTEQIVLESRGGGMRRTWRQPMYCL